MKLVVRNVSLWLTAPVIAAIVLNLATMVWFKTMDLSVGESMGSSIELSFAIVAYLLLYRRLDDAASPPRATAGYLAFINGAFAIASAGAGQSIVMVLLALACGGCLLSVYFQLRERVRA